MIKTYANKVTEQIANAENPKRIANDLVARSLMRLIQLDNAVILDDLRVPISNRLEKLAGNRANCYSIRVNRQWRICFKFENGHAYEVELVDYH